jgi:alpha,alpha-trehalase
MYGWDSYFIGLGLLVDDRPDLIKGMVQNFMFEIGHYGKIPNANRSYYLVRSQPPFLTDMALRTYKAIKNESGSKLFLKKAILTAIKEYHGVWMAPPRYDHVSGLSRYGPAGVGVLPEVEPGHYDFILIPHAKARGMTVPEFIAAYNEQQVEDHELDKFFQHDRAVRESGHDTSHRVENVCADLATIDLNSLLYRYETDIAATIRDEFGDTLVVPKEFCASGQEPNHVETSATWTARAAKRKALIDKYLWNEEKGMYFDYNTDSHEQSTYECATTLWALWSGLASPSQASKLLSHALPLLEQSGGIVTGTLRSATPDRDHQWDYPYGWAPHQMLAWDGLIRYGYRKEAERTSYRWLHTVLAAYGRYNGIVVEKYDVTKIGGDPRDIDTGYGNQGDDASAEKRGGFGWTNASFVYGMSIVSDEMKEALGQGKSWEEFSNSGGAGSHL